jgi:kynurenine formamidase
MAYVLLSYPINEKTPLYVSLPAFSVSPYSMISKGDPHNTAIISIHNHIGTHIDAPKHFINNGKSIFEYTLDDLIFENPILVNCLKESCLNEDELLILPDDLKPEAELLQKSDCLLICTGFGQHRNEEKYRTHNPGIAPETILWIRKEYPKIRCIGIDSISISSFQHINKGIDAHIASFSIKEELGSPLLLIEDMNLSTLLNYSLKQVIVLPWQVDGIDSAPCTVLAEIELDPI